MSDRAFPDPQDTITILVQDRKIVCSKKTLKLHSDYFNVMFSRNYRETHERTITLKEVDGNAMEELIRLLSDKAYLPNITNICKVLIISDMFLFDDLKDVLAKRTIISLSKSNCLQIWMNLKMVFLVPLIWKAKSMSLTEFNAQRDLRTINALTFSELVHYLGHINLQCEREIDVFNALLDWFHSNNQSVHSISFQEILGSVINFNDITLPELAEMQNHHEIMKYPDIVNILGYVMYYKINRRMVHVNNFSLVAESWLTRKGRYLPKYLCVLNMKQKVEIFYQDRYKDPFLKKVATIPSKVQNLVGYGIQVYGTKILIFGGEFFMGTGVWNQDIFEFSLDEQKLTKTKYCLPFKRRHFNSCLIGDILYIIGGTGPHRVKANNMYCFNFKTGTWEPMPIMLPCEYVPSKYCDHGGRLFILDCNMKCGYFYLNERAEWYRVRISERVDMKESHDLSVFSYRGNLFLKGKNLVELLYNHADNVFRPIETTTLPDFIRGRLLETAISHNRVYSFYVDHLTPDIIRLEYLDLDNYTSLFFIKLGVFQEFKRNMNKSYYLSEHYGANLQYTPDSMMRMFMYHHRDLVESEDILN